VEGTAFVVRDVRAVRGVGALIWDFFGVSVTCFVRLDKLADDKSAFAGEGLMTLARRPPATKGCRMAACGLIRFSGSHVRHLEMKSTKSSSVHRRTCASDFVPGRRLLPFELTTGRGPPWLSAQRTSQCTVS
jgi:hypothetical protein